MPESDNDSGGPSNTGGEGELSSPREQDRFLPIANVSRIMKKALPANAKISKDAKETVQECVVRRMADVVTCDDSSTGSDDDAPPVAAPLKP